jgi:hypothetical protein
MDYQSQLIKSLLNQNQSSISPEQERNNQPLDPKKLAEALKKP